MEAKTYSIEACSRPRKNIFDRVIPELVVANFVVDFWKRLQ